MDMKERIVCALCAVFLLLAFLYVGYMESHYTRMARYVGDNKFVDKCGYVWEYEGDFKKNQHYEYELVMFDNHTETITDDEIIKIK